MRIRLQAGLAAAAIVALFAAGSSQATESSSVLYNSAAGDCSQAAATAARTGTATLQQIDACSAALSLPMSAHAIAATHLNRSTLSLTRGDYSAAVADADAALRLRPNMPEALIDRGAAERGLHRYAEAIADYTKALTLDPKAPETVYFNRALAREDSGDLNGAYADYQKAASLNPSWKEASAQLTRFAPGSQVAQLPH